MSGPVTPRKSLRFAVTLNLMLPGAGQLYLGQTVLGAIYLTIFGATFAAVLTIFLRAYARYLELTTSGDILAGDNLEQLSRAFPVRWLVGLAAVAVVIYGVALASLRAPQTQPPDFTRPTS